MKIKLECRGPNEKDWSTLSTDDYPLGARNEDDSSRRRAEMAMHKRQAGWASYFLDHTFRIVTPDRQ